METRRWRDYNWPLLVCVLVLLVISTLAVHSATLNALTNGIPLRTIYPGHIINMAIGLGVMTALTLVNYQLMASLARPAYLIALGLLILVPLIGRVSGGAQSWIALGTRTFQPSEIGKLALILALAAFWQRYEDRRDTWPVQCGALVLAGIPLLMVFAQPDLGTAMVMASIWFVMAWGAGIRWSQLFTLVLVGAPMIAVGWGVALDDYQRQRLLTFYYQLTDPSKVDFNAGYNVIQALNAISAGGMVGAGLTRGLFSQGNYVPVQHTDFIFAVIGEELGFIGSVVLIAFQALLLWQALTIAGQARDTFGRLIALGVFGMLFSHMLINIGMNMSLLPVTGLPLPLISHGGSFMITVLAAIGLLQSVALRQRRLSF